MKNIILITGTPATGKTTLARMLSQHLGYTHVDVNHLIRKQHWYDSYDSKRRCYVVDTQKLRCFLVSLLKKSSSPLLLDSHLVQVIPKKYVTVCLVTRCCLPQLSRRLKRRHYPLAKIQENLQAEIFDVCTLEAQKQGYPLVEIDTTHQVSIRALMKKIKKFICREYLSSLRRWT